jgi:cyclic beta-1,2-glucan synthetase
LSPASATSAGLGDALALAAQEAVSLGVGQRTQTVTPRQLEELIDAMSRMLARGDDAAMASAEWDKLAGDAEVLIDIASAIALERSDGAAADLLYWSQAILSGIAAHRSDLALSGEAIALRGERLLALENAFREIAMAMEFGFLFDRKRQLLSIGYLISESALDSNCYDLLASEARLASFFAIAKGDIPTRHWFRLGRAATPVARGSALISWSGSMFEYLMPPLVMREPSGSLLEQTDRLIVRRQIEYGAKRGLPWGISESAYNARDLEFTYQYSNFGVPGLGLK